MPVHTTREPNDVIVLHFRGVLKRSEFAGTQNAAVPELELGAHPRLLVVLQDFEGWERGADWNDLDFMITHGNKIAKIAIVGDPRWEAEALAFAGAGFRRAPVQFFPQEQSAAARTWLEE